MRGVWGLLGMASLCWVLAGVGRVSGLAAEMPAPEAKVQAEGEGKKEASKPDEVKKEAPQVAHIVLKGSLGEEPVPAEGLFGPPPENLRAKIDRIVKAARDPKVAALYIEIGPLDIGFGKLNELKRAIATVQAAHKKVFAYCEDPGTKELLLGLTADLFAIPEGGTVSLVGLRAEVTLYKNALDLLRLKADVLKIGDYKSAVEPFIRDTLSKENREQLEALTEDHFEQELVAGIIAARPGRKWTAAEVRALIDNGPYIAADAARRGLVDRVAYKEAFEKSFPAELGVQEAKVIRDYGKAKGQDLDPSNPFALLAVLSPKKKKESKNDKIAVIYAVGGISTGKGSVNPLMGETVGSDTLVQAIREAEDNPTVKALVLRIDSPGGSALASDLIWNAIVQCKKPVVASMGDTAASGGYYIAMGCKKIFAEPGTLTGSIGVFGMKLVTGGLEEWIGLKTEVIARGKNSGVLSTTFPWSDSERQALTQLVQSIYDVFIDKALAGRKAAGRAMTREELLKLAGGRVWTGRQAHAHGLVDALGTLDDAIAAAKTLAGIDPKTELEILVLPKAQSFLDKLVEGDLELPFFGPAGLQRVKSIPGGEKALKLIAPLMLQRSTPAIQALLPFHIEWK